MTTKPDVTLSRIFTALRAWTAAITGIPLKQVYRAYQDNLPEPYPYPFCYLSIISTERKSTNDHDVRFDVSTGKTLDTTSVSMTLTAQLDIYGPEAPEIAMVVDLMFRDYKAVYNYEQYKIAPCYCTSPVMMTAGRDEHGGWAVRASLRMVFSFTQSITTSDESFKDPVLEVVNATLIKEN